MDILDQFDYCFKNQLPFKNILTYFKDVWHQDTFKFCIKYMEQLDVDDCINFIRKLENTTYDTYIDLCEWFVKKYKNHKEIQKSHIMYSFWVQEQNIYCSDVRIYCPVIIKNNITKP